MACRFALWALSALFVLSCTKEPSPLAPPSPSPAAKATSVATDRAALVAFYHATKGDYWWRRDNWLSDAPLGDWFGVETNDQGRVIRLGDMSVGKGFIPPELGNLSQLVTLVLSNNSLSGPIPPELGNLSQLVSLNLKNNQLSGPIPPELGRLDKLEWLVLGMNNLSGPIPPELGNLSQLEYLDIWENMLSGPIPAELGALNLKSVRIGRNLLTGCIPESWRDAYNFWLPARQEQNGRIGFLDFCSEEETVSEEDDTNVPEVPEPNFNIEFRFVEEIPVAYQNQLERAAARFERIIVSDLPDIDFKTWPVNEYSYHLRKRIVVNQPVDDLLVLVGQRDLPGGVASAGVMRIRVRGKLPVVATLTLDVDALSDNTSEEVYSTMLHELGHCLGFGLVWEQLGLIKGYRTPYFTGPITRALFAALGGDKFRGLAVPVDTRDRGHWSGPVFWDELMAKGWYYPFKQPLSAITIAQFADLGYQVDYTEADAYTVLGRGAAKRPPADEEVHHDLFQGQVLEVDEDGRVVR